MEHALWNSRTASPSRGRKGRFSPAHRPAAKPRQAALRVAGFALLWWILAGGDPRSWPVGVPAVALAAAMSLRLLPSPPLSFAGALRFVPFFLWHSLRGGVDVARRALAPARPIDPGLLVYPLQLPRGAPCLFMALVTSLLPGTLSVELRGDRLHIHLLVRRATVRGELLRVEAAVARLFALPPPVPRTGRVQ